MNGPLVVKLGGSLLDWPPLPGRLATLLQGLRDRRPVLIVGGGPAADFVRTLDLVHGLGEPAAHALALHALDLTAHALASMMPGLVVVDRLDLLESARASGRIPVLAPRRFLDDEDRDSTDPLPHDWSVTTDTIAARLAVRLDASCLLMLKSAPAPVPTTRSEAARLGLVDTAFEKTAASLGRVCYRNLRDDNASTVLLAPFPSTHSREPGPSSG
ncbi:uridylate kinase [Isosphaeraceae bacterium EP7]